MPEQSATDMQMVSVSELKPYPRNNEFFDDIEGDNWADFLESVEENGVIAPIVISGSDYIIVSGHQRVRACKELGIEEIPCRLRSYETEDALLRELLITNLKQRGIGNPNPIKLARCLKELIRIDDIWETTSGKPRRRGMKTQSDLASELGTSVDQVGKYKRLLELIPELQDLIETKQMSVGAGLSILSKMNKEDQMRIVSEIGKDQIAAMTRQQTMEFLDKLKAAEVTRNELESTVDDLSKKIETKDKELKKAKADNADKVKKAVAAKEAEMKEFISERDEKIKRLERDMALAQEEADLYKSDSNKLNELKTNIEAMTNEKDSLAQEIIAVKDVAGLAVEISDMLKEKLAPIKYSMTIKQVQSPIVKRNLTEIVESVQSWCDELRNLINLEEYIDV